MRRTGTEPSIPKDLLRRQGTDGRGHEPLTNLQFTQRLNVEVRLEAQRLLIEFEFEGTRELSESTKPRDWRMLFMTSIHKGGNHWIVGYIKKNEEDKKDEGGESDGGVGVSWGETKYESVVQAGKREKAMNGK